jgi:uncharacterized protein (DUF433 family)
VKPVVIKNPILNSPFEEPRRRYRFDDDDITDEVADARRPSSYYPDYLLRVDDGRGTDDLLNLVVEISGQQVQDKEAKLDTVVKLCVPAVNAEGTFGRWDFLEITDPRNAQHAIRQFLSAPRSLAAGNMEGGGGHPPHHDANNDPDDPMLKLIRKTANVLGGDARILDTRIAVWMLVRAWQLGLTDEQIRNRYQPPLTEADLAAAWRYYDTHREEIEDTIWENEEA